MGDRTKKIFTEMKKKKLESLLVTSSFNIAYLTGLRIDYGCVILSKKVLHFITDSRYSEMAEKDSQPGTKVITIKENLINSIKDLMSEDGIKSLGFETANLKLGFYNNLKKQLSKIKLVETNNIVEEARMIKDSEEIKKIKKAVLITDQAFSFIFEFIKKNFSKKISEQKISWELEKYIRDNGGDDRSFQFIIASGSNSSVPHHLSGKRILKKGDMIIIDFGVKVDGYCSDLTRTIFLGNPDENQRKIYQKVLDVQQAVIKKIKPGLTGIEIDRQARKIFDITNDSKNFLHGLGHGVGLEIHELPFINRYRVGNNLKIKENMIFTIEPGLYFADWGGARIEDIVLVASTGCQVLSKAPKKLEEMIIKI